MYWKISNKPLKRRAMRTPKVGQYEYGRRGRCFKIYRVESVNENGYIASSIGELYSDREEARRRVWALNGWGTPKSKLN